MKKKVLLLLLTGLFLSNLSQAQELTMFPSFFGYEFYQDDVKITKQAVSQLMLQDSEANVHWEKSKRHLTYSWIAVGAQVGFLIWGSERSRNDQNTDGPLIGFLGSSAAVIGFSLSTNTQRKNAILKYNKKQTLSSINFGPTRNGMGLVVQF